MKKPFTKKIAREIALKSFGYTLDCVLGYSDPNYSLTTDVSEFEQNFEEDLLEKDIAITPYRVKTIVEIYQKEVEKFETLVRKKYYK